MRKGQQRLNRTKLVLVCSKEELISRRKFRTVVNDREIFLIHHKGNFYALDRYCYHNGGPIHQGDIEDFGGYTCIVCPWHKYKVCLSTGESIYQSVDPKNSRIPPEWKSMGPKQRTHKVVVQDENVYVQLNEEGKLDSDYYYSEEYKKIKQRLDAARAESK